MTGSATFNTAGGLVPDWTLLTQPGYVYTGQSLVRGELPFWNSKWFAGYPHLAVPSNGVFYPTTVLFGLFAFPFAAGIVTLTHIYLFGAFAYWLGRDMYERRLPSMCLACWIVTGTATTWPLSAGHLWTLLALTWSPLVFLFHRRILLTGHAVWAIVLAPLVAMMCVAGDPQGVAFFLYGLWFYATSHLVIRGVLRKDSIRLLAVKGALCVVGVLGGILLAGVQLVPSQEFIAQSVRKDGVSYRYLIGSFPSIVEAFKTIAFATLEPTGFIPGKVSLALALVAIVGVAGSEVIALWIAIAACFVYADLPEGLFEGVVRHVPVLNSIRGTSRIGMTIVFLGYVLGGHGVNALQAALAVPTARWLWVATGTLALALFFCAFAHSPVVPTVGMLTVAAMAALTAGVVWRRWTPTWVGALLAAILCAEGVDRYRREVTVGDPAVFTVRADVSRFLHDTEDGDRVLLLQPSQPTGHGAATTLLAGGRNVEGYHALVLYRYARLLREVAGVPLALTDASGRLNVQGYYGADWVTPASLPVLDLLNVRYITRFGARVPLAERAIETNTGRFSVATHGELVVYTNHAAFPPAFLVHEVVAASDEQALALFRTAGGFDYRKRATLPMDSKPLRTAPASGPESVTLRRYDPRAIEVTVRLTAPALLVLSEMWYPGWYARVDAGPQEPTLCVDTALQGVPVDAGEHTVTFVYQPPSFAYGLAVTAVTAALWMTCVVALFRRKPSSIHLE